jgi:hypothetical protein
LNQVTLSSRVFICKSKFSYEIGKKFEQISKSIKQVIVSETERESKNTVSGRPKDSLL